MSFSILFCIFVPDKNSFTLPLIHTSIMATVYDFKVFDKKKNQVSLSDYKGKVLLIVNTATGCGFTPQYEDLEAMYHRLKDQGFEILDFPYNQFGQQTPGTDEEITEFCTVKFGADFPQFKKSEVNGEDALPLFKWLKEQKGFEGFDMEDPIAPILVDMFDKTGSNWRETPDIKWNFTKFLINREGNVVSRFEPTHNMKDVEEQVKKLL